MPELLDKVNSPADLKKLPVSKLSRYADEVREYIIDTVGSRGGHLSSNLGAVELTIALHYALNAPTDKIVFDVGHQSYTHKIITGRRDSFASLRTEGGLSGFPSPHESEYDPYTMGHSSTSLSIALGCARARDIRKENYCVAAVIGDGAFTGGMVFEALNDIGANHERMIIVLNDNKMSISKNVGALSEYFARLRLSAKYTAIKYNIKRGLSTLPFFGDFLADVMDKAKDGIKLSLLHDKIFESMGIGYYGPLDGHDIPTLVDVLKKMRNKPGPVLLHVVTTKGNGGEADVVKNPDRYHGVGPKCRCKNTKSFAAVAGAKMCDLAEKHDDVVAVTAAMSMGTGLEDFSARFKARYFDVGIAEEHAAAMCAGLAGAGLRPYFAVYSSFLQRAFDQALHDICIDRRAVTLLVDHAGVVGGDGVTHQGLYDIAFLSIIPNMTILQPKDGEELKRMLDFSVSFGAPLAIRYPKAYACEIESREPFDGLKWETLVRGKTRVTVLAAGSAMISLALSCHGATVVNARVIKPLDTDFLDSIPDGSAVITLEEGVLRGGFGESVRSYFSAVGRRVETITFGFPDEFLRNLSEEGLFEAAGITADKLSAAIEKCNKTA